MEYTTKWKLSKPTYDDDVDIQVLNNNFDIIDGKLQTVSVSDNTLHVDDKSYPLNYMPIAGGNFTGDITIKENEVDYIIEHAEQGRSYYNKYKSGKLVQVIYKDRTQSGVTGINVDTLTFLTPFIDETYLAWVSYEINVLTRYGWQNSTLNPTVAGTGSKGTTEPRWGERSKTSMAVTVDTQTDVYALLIGRWK